MRNIIDRIFCALLILATAGHLFGTIKLFDFGTGIFVWSLSGVLAAALLVAINILRNLRPSDRPLARIAFAGNIGWLAIVLLFGQSIGNLLDPRAVFHGIAALGLIFFSFKTLRG